MKTEPTAEQAVTEDLPRSPVGPFPAGLNVPMPMGNATPVEYAESLGRAYLSFADRARRKSGGQYLTAAPIARFMAARSSPERSHLRVLDPGSGAGVLSAAVGEAAPGGSVRSMHVDAYETDPLLARLTHLALAFSREWLTRRGVALTFSVRQEDFVLRHAAALDAASRIDGRGRDPGGPGPAYDLVIANPPYAKIGGNDPRAIAGASVVHGQPNLYALFMAVSAALLSESGRLVHIVPRSFASGPYFRRFRDVFFERVVPVSIHLFESRRDVFRRQTVLQENLVITARNRTEGEAPDEGRVLISHSEGAHDLSERRHLPVDLRSVLDPASANGELCIPVRAEDVALVRAVRSWPHTLRSLGLEASTGPVVPFRATRFLTHAASEPATVPLLWMHHVRPMRIEWPIVGNGKPQHIRNVPDSSRLLVRDGTYVLLRRFSAKEERRRLVAAPLVGGSLDADVLGLENHLNYVRGVSRELDEELALGLSALLNSTLLDRYFRLSNGNTQVSATELRGLPLPAKRDIRAIGAGAYARIGVDGLLSELDELVAGVLDLSPELCRGEPRSGE